MGADLVTWIGTPLGQAAAAIVGMLTLGAIALGLFGASVVDRYIPADQGERVEPVDFNDTAAAIDSAPISLSERERVDQLLRMPPRWVRPSWTAQPYQAAALDALEDGAEPIARVCERIQRPLLELAVIHMPAPSSDGAASLQHRFDNRPAGSDRAEVNPTH